TSFSILMSPFVPSTHHHHHHA
nr:Chain C, Adhesion G-protein coupled receptor F1 [Homo sapiens]